MYLSNLPEDILGQVLNLTKEEMEDLGSAFEGVFSDHKLYELKSYLNSSLRVCLTSDDPPFNEPQKRDTTITYYEALIRIVETAWLIADKRLKEATQQAVPPLTNVKDNAITKIANMILAHIQGADDHVAHVFIVRSKAGESPESIGKLFFRWLNDQPSTEEII